MKRMTAMLLLLALLPLGGCTSLPGEERAFAVCLGVGRNGGVWQACARVPTYQDGGGYLTLSAEGTSLAQALSALDAASPMPLHYGQLRLAVFSRETAEAEDFPQTLTALALLPDFRLRCALCVTEEPLSELMDALTPETGLRLSKYLEALLDARITQGLIPSTTLSDLRRMGERQSGMLADMTLEEVRGGSGGGEADTTAGDAGKQTAETTVRAQFGGAWLMSRDGPVTSRLSARECQMLNLLAGSWRDGTLSLPEGTAQLLDAQAKVTLASGTARCELRLRCGRSDMTEEGVRQAVTRALELLTSRLSAAGCDALGLARQAIRGYSDLAAWHDADWSRVYAALAWDVRVTVTFAA